MCTAHSSGLPCCIPKPTTGLIGRFHVLRHFTLFDACFPFLNVVSCCWCVQAPPPQSPQAWRHLPLLPCTAFSHRWVAQGSGADGIAHGTHVAWMRGLHGQHGWRDRIGCIRCLPSNLCGASLGCIHVHKVLMARIFPQFCKQAHAACVLACTVQIAMTPEQYSEMRTAREMNERNRFLTDEELDSMLPGEKEGYKVRKQGDLG